MKDISNYSLKEHNTFGIEARCTRFLEYCTVDEARDVAAILRETEDPYIIIGGGSNLLLTRDFEGVVVHSALMGVDIDGCRMTCGSGMEWDRIVAMAVEHGLYGAENLSLIPGDVGASAVQNIGAYGVEAADYIVAVHCISLQDGSERLFSNAECNYSYRHSIFKEPGTKGHYAVVSVDYKLNKTFVPRLEYGGIRRALQPHTTLTAQTLRETIIEIRRQKLPDPQVLGNAGSFFMNPIISKEQFSALQQRYPDIPSYIVDEDHIKVPAGWMIEQCGWKGRSLGQAAVHDRQALVLVNKGGATGADIVNLCETVRAAVQETFGIKISPEVNFI